MAKELERAGLPTAFITAMVPLARSIGANRIVQGRAVTHTTGDPSLSPKEEKLYRRKLVQSALESLRSQPEDQEVIWDDAGDRPSG